MDKALGLLPRTTKKKKKKKERKKKKEPCQAQQPICLSCFFAYLPTLRKEKF
jgi:hypothetical protein